MSRGFLFTVRRYHSYFKD